MSRVDGATARFRRPLHDYRTRLPSRIEISDADYYMYMLYSLYKYRE